MNFFARLFLRFSPIFARVRRLPGVGSLAHRVSRRVLGTNELVWVTVRNGIGKGLWLQLYPRTGQHYYQGSVEPAIQGILGKRLSHDMVFYDLGANIGFFTLIAARAVGPNGKVVAFEADPEVARRLRTNVEKNGFGNVRVVQQAVWSSSGHATFGRADAGLSQDRGTGSVLTSPQPGRGTIEVSSVALDDFSQEESPPGMIKCDVEGAEFQVLLGARRTITQHRPLIVCELHSDANAALVATLLEELNYSFEWLTKTHIFASPRSSC